MTDGRSTERVVHLALSQKAAKLLVGIMSEVHETRAPRERAIIKAIYTDLREQIERPKKGTKK